MIAKALRPMLIFCLGLCSGSLVAANHFNVLLYHHVSDTTPPSTTISVKGFQEHMQYLKDNDFQVLALGDAIGAIQSGEPLPDRSVVITFDDAYRSIHTNALPILKAHDFPFTVFVATDPIDQKFPQMMTWDMLRDLQQHQGTLANHTKDHAYLVRHQPRDGKWVSETLANIEHAQQRLETELGIKHKWLAYPYGEYHTPLKQALAQAGYLGFGQHSGGIHAGSDFLALPRFPAAGIYSNLNTLKVKLNSRPMPVTYENLSDPVLTQDAEPPILTVTLTETLPKSIRNQLACFVLGERLMPTWKDERTFVITSNQALPKGRSRYNCTAPALAGGYYWMSLQWLVW